MFIATLLLVHFFIMFKFYVFIISEIYSAPIAKRT